MDSVEWIRIGEAIRSLHVFLKDRLSGEEPAPWINPPADPDECEEAKQTFHHRQMARTSLTMSRALLSSDLTAHLVKDGDSRPLPCWAWENFQALQNAFLFSWLPLDPFRSHGLHAYSDWRCFVRRAEFDTWLSNPTIAELGELPDLPIPSDRESCPDPTAYREPRQKPFVELTEALTWVAFSLAMSRDEFAVGEQYRFGPFAQTGWPDALRHATAKFADQASAGSIRVRGRYVANYFDHSATAQANTDYLSDTQLRDFACFESVHGGLERGVGLVWETNVLERAFDGRGDGWRDVEVCRSELLNHFPLHAPAIPASEKLGGDSAPPNRKLNHDEIIQRAADMIAAQPGISKGSAAASIVTELPPNPRSGKPRDTRHIERMIAHLWEGGLS